MSIAFHHQHLGRGQRQTAIECLQSRVRPHRLHACNLLQQFPRPTINPHPPRLPQWPVDRPRPPTPLSCFHLHIAIPCILVHKPIRCRVIRLPYIPQCSRRRRKQHKQIQSHLSARLIQVVRHRHFRRKHSFKHIPPFFHDEIIRYHPRTMQYPLKLSALFLDPRYHPLHLCQIPQIQLPITHPPPPPHPPFQPPLLFLPF